ncbi:acyl-CoA-binding domain-containing protein 3-like isoform X2 [Diospyros lotus]|uniref:acyl-CoA-binding domain-containing protein 3-like isoform X2 n=1 Tax=Diospyros lotus TaxID=55363 RepID=UPI00224FF70E|nr:acyl-CoA-binding domain-containing protein 3-like isoform X2 [Diospyros lotus]
MRQTQTQTQSRHQAINLLYTSLFPYHSFLLASSSFLSFDAHSLSLSRFCLLSPLLWWIIMELLDRELLFATFVTLFFSFILAKLISLAVAGSGDELGSKSTETADSAEKVVEDMKFVGGLRVQRSETKNRVQFVEEALEKVDDFGGETSVDASDKLLCGQEFKEKRCDSAGDVSDVVGSSEKSPGGGLSEDEVAMEVLRGIGVEGRKEENVFTHSDGLVVDLTSEGAEVDEFDGVDREERITGLVVEENAVENTEADDEMVAKLASGENQRSGIEEELTKEDEKKGGLVDEDEDDWEGIERSELQGTFAAAANYVDQLPDLDSDVQMQLYGLHKVATEGPCYETQPMVLKVSARTKCGLSEQGHQGLTMNKFQSIP